MEESGVLSWRVNEGAAVNAGELLASLEIDNPDNVEMVTTFSGSLSVRPASKTGNSTTAARPHLLLRSAIDTLDETMAGYLKSADSIEGSLSNLSLAVTRPMLPVCEVEEQLAVLSGRIPASLFDGITAILTDFKNSCDMQAGTGVELR